MHGNAKRRGIRRGSIVTLVAAVTGTLVALTGCSAGGDASPSSSPSGSSAHGDTLTLAANYGPTSLNPVLQNVDQINNWYINLAYDTLIHLDGDGKVQPDLATSWKYTNSNNTALELTLRKGIKFSDGSPITASDVVASLQYAIKNGVNGPAWMGSVTGVTAPSSSTVDITTGEPNDALPFLLTQRVLLGSIISPAGLSSVEKLKSASFGAGPYVLDTADTVSNDTYVYTPNKYYWDKSKIHWNKIVIKVAANSAAALQAVQSGQADMFSGDAATNQAAKSAGLTVAAAPFGLTGVNYIDRTGQLTPALKDPRVRQALSYAINRPQIANALFGDFAVPTATPAAEGIAGWSKDDAKAYGYNPAKAKKLLKQAGYADGFSFDMATTNGNSANLMAQAVVQDWAAIGVTAHLTTYSDNNQLITDILGHKYSVAVYGYGVLPMYIQAKSFYSGGANQYNPWNTTDSAISADLVQAAAGKTAADQDKFYVAANHRALVDLAWLTSVYTRDTTMIYDPKKISGITVSSLNPVPDIAWDIVPASGN